jgi:hypothetical protein
MTFLPILKKDFKTDPGLLFDVDAQTRRDWDEINERWNFNTVLRISNAPWAYWYLPKIEGEYIGTDRRFRFRCRVHIDSIDTDAVGYINLGDNKIAIPQMAVCIDEDAGVVRAVALAGGTVGVPIVMITPPFTFDVVATFDPVDGWTVETFTTGGSSYGTSTIPGVTLPVGLIFFGTRDGIQADDPLKTINGWIDDVFVELDVDPDVWTLIISEPTGEETIIELNKVGIWDNLQDIDESIIGGIGRPWASVYHDGAGPLSIIVEGTLYYDLADIYAIDAAIRSAKVNNKVVSLISPITGYTLRDAKVSVWEAPVEFGRLNNRDFNLEVRSRRKPQVE